MRWGAQPTEADRDVRQPQWDATSRKWFSKKADLWTPVYTVRDRHFPIESSP